MSTVKKNSCLDNEENLDENHTDVQQKTALLMISIMKIRIGYVRDIKMQGESKSTLFLELL